MSKIFISYSSHDQTAVQYIADQIESRGADVFVDYQKLKGDDFVPRLGRDIVYPGNQTDKWQELR
jgi:hypothetical protein